MRGRCSGPEVLLAAGDRDLSFNCLTEASPPALGGPLEWESPDVCSLQLEARPGPEEGLGPDVPGVYFIRDLSFM